MPKWPSLIILTRAWPTVPVAPKMMTAAEQGRGFGRFRQGGGGAGWARELDGW
jgi:hypothetical protein